MCDILFIFHLFNTVTPFISISDFREVSVVLSVQRIMNTERSIHSAGIDEIHNMPITEINRPIPSVLDPEKVDSIANTLEENPDAVPPLDVSVFINN
jgi:hypothetical protein